MKGQICRDWRGQVGRILYMLLSRESEKNLGEKQEKMQKKKHKIWEKARGTDRQRDRIQIYVDWIDL